MYRWFYCDFTVNWVNTCLVIKYMIHDTWYMMIASYERRRGTRRLLFFICRRWASSYRGTRLNWKKYVAKWLTMVMHSDFEFVATSKWYAITVFHDKGDISKSFEFKNNWDSYFKLYHSNLARGPERDKCQAVFESLSTIVKKLVRHFLRSGTKVKFPRFCEILIFFPDALLVACEPQELERRGEKQR